MESKRNTGTVEVKPQSEKKVWVTPTMEIIGTDNIEAGNRGPGPEGKRTFNSDGTYVS